MGKEMILLIHEAEPAPFRRQIGDVLMVHESPAPKESGVAGNGLEQGGFSGTGRTDDQGVATARDFQRDIAQVKASHSDLQIYQSNHAGSSGCSTRTRRNTARATTSRITAAGTAAGSPNAVNRSKMRMLATLGLYVRMTIEPNSLTLRAQARMEPARIPLPASGRVTRRKAPQAVSPKVQATRSSCGSTPRNASRAPLTRIGAETNSIAATIPGT